MEKRKEDRTTSSSSHPADDCEVVSVASEEENEDHHEQYMKNSRENIVEKFNGNPTSYPPQNLRKDNHNQKRYRKKRKHKISRRFINIFNGSAGSGGKVTPTDIEANHISHKHTHPRNPHVYNMGDNMQMKTIKETGHSDEEFGNGNSRKVQYTNQAFQRHQERRRAYDSNIYSVNSAGNPVPITIESENEDAEIPDGQNGGTAVNTKDAHVAIAKNPRRCCGFSTPQILDKNGKPYSLWKTTYQPDSFGMSIWLLIITLGFLYNMWTIPLRGTFYSAIQSPWQDIWFACDALYDLIFVIDIFIIFRTSYVKSGVYVTDTNDLNQYHRRKWTLVLDVLAILPTDLFFIRTINPYLRLNRLLKIHRAVKFYFVVEKASTYPNVWRCINMFHAYAIPVHYNACFYYGLSENHGYGDTLSSWMYPNPKLFPDYTALYRRYTHSFYWSCTRLSVVGGHALPETNWQYIFSLYMQLCGVIMTVSLIAFVTSLFIGKFTPKIEFERTIDSTRDYMRHRKLPKDLQNRVIGFFQYCWERRQFGNLEENSLLGYLPSSIREEMEVHANFESLKQVSIFSLCDEGILRQLVMKLQRRLYLPGQFVYRTGDAADEMYIVGEGVMQVVREGHPTVFTIVEGEVFGDENVLGPHQFIRRVGDVVSYGYSELYVLSYKDVLAILSKYPRTLHNIRHRRKYLAMRQNPECKAFGGKYFRLSSSNGTTDTSLKSLSNIQYRLNSKLGSSRHSQTDSSGYTSNMAFSDLSYAQTHVSPDSDYDEENGKRNSLTSNQLPHLDATERLNMMYEENMRNMKVAMEEIWGHELRSVRIQLQDAENERDLKTKEISQLKRRVPGDATSEKTPNSKGNVNSKPQTSAGGDVLEQEGTNKPSTSDVSSSRDDDRNQSKNTSTHDVIPSKLPIAKERRARIQSYQPRRTLLGRTNNTTVIRTVQKETGLDMFGSMNSITNPSNPS